jgi:hypothetical protein
MPVVFDDVHAEVAPPPQAEGSGSGSTTSTAAAPSDGDAAEVMREKLQLWSQRELRLEAD